MMAKSICKKIVLATENMNNSNGNMLITVHRA